MWIGTCSQSNLITAIGIHRAPLLGYATDSFLGNQNTQKFNCHKLIEFEVGLHNSGNGLTNPHMPVLAKQLVNKQKNLSMHIRERVEFYADLL